MASSTAIRSTSGSVTMWDPNGYVGIAFEGSLSPADVEFSDDVVLVLPETARQIKEAKPAPEAPVSTVRLPEAGSVPGGKAEQQPIFTGERVAAVSWEGEVPWQKWTTFYNKVLSGLAGEDVELTVRFAFSGPAALSHVRPDEAPNDVSCKRRPDEDSRGPLPLLEQSIDVCEQRLRADARAPRAGVEVQAALRGEQVETAVPSELEHRPRRRDVQDRMGGAGQRAPQPAGELAGREGLARREPLVRPEPEHLDLAVGRPRVRLGRKREAVHGRPDANRDLGEERDLVRPDPGQIALEGGERTPRALNPHADAPPPGPRRPAMSRSRRWCPPAAARTPCVRAVHGRPRPVPARTCARGRRSGTRRSRGRSSASAPGRCPPGRAARPPGGVHPDRPGAGRRAAFGRGERGRPAGASAGPRSRPCLGSRSSPSRGRAGSPFRRCPARRSRSPSPPAGRAWPRFRRARGRAARP